ncbi:hypothetical protein O3P69_009597 [Scylla paramamosain]|uniref:Uncharacterized protein n=1 Tax=Scylla paramamosain TaxID=85552 RepID=A0AAW0SV74_SCYPA
MLGSQRRGLGSSGGDSSAPMPPCLPVLPGSSGTTSSITRHTLQQLLVTTEILVTPQLPPAPNTAKQHQRGTSSFSLHRAPPSSTREARVRKARRRGWGRGRFEAGPKTPSSAGLSRLTAASAQGGSMRGGQGSSGRTSLAFQHSMRPLTRQKKARRCWMAFLLEPYSSWCQAFSMGYRSGELPGHSNTVGSKVRATAVSGAWYGSPEGKLYFAPDTAVARTLLPFNQHAVCPEGWLCDMMWREPLLTIVPRSQLRSLEQETKCSHWDHSQLLQRRRSRIHLAHHFHRQRRAEFARAVLKHCRQLRATHDPRPPDMTSALSHRFPPALAAKYDRILQQLLQELRECEVDPVHLSPLGTYERYEVEGVPRVAWVSRERRALSRAMASFPPAVRTVMAQVLRPLDSLSLVDVQDGGSVGGVGEGVELAVLITRWRAAARAGRTHLRNNWFPTSLAAIREATLATSLSPCTSPHRHARLQ